RRGSGCGGGDAHLRDRAGDDRGHGHHRGRHAGGHVSADVQADQRGRRQGLMPTGRHGTASSAMDRAVVGAALVRLGLLTLTGCLGLLGPHASGTAREFGLLTLAGLALTAVEWLGLRRLGRSTELVSHYVGDVALLTAALLWGGSQQ